MVRQASEAAREWVTLRAGAATDTGRVRQINEDSLLSCATLFVVADGMGGHAAGEVASSIAVDRLRNIGDRLDLKPDDVRVEIGLANQEILDQVREYPEHAGMGTTVAGIGLVWVGGTQHWVVFNVGDSRVYRFVRGTLVQMTVDHSEVEELVAAGFIGPDEARDHPRRNVVTRALGMDPAPEPDVWVLPPTAGERFLVCSDGLCGEVSDAGIAEVLAAEPVAGDAAIALVQAALEAGGRDNVTVIVVDHIDVDGDGGDAAPRSRRVEVEP